MLYYIISGGIVTIGFCICLFLIFRHRRKAKAIRHYEKIRDKLTLREPEPEPEPEIETSGGGGMLGNLIGGFIVVMVGINLIPEIAKQVTEIQGANNATIDGPAADILGLTTIFFALGIMAAGVSLAIGGLKNGGIM